VEICRKLGISEQTFYTWKRKYSGIRLNEFRELRQLRDENAKLKKLVADLSLDRHMLQEIVRKRLRSLGIGAFWRAGRKPPTRRVSVGCRGWFSCNDLRCVTKAIAIGRKRCACD
jgi:putative transposase